MLDFVSDREDVSVDDPTGDAEDVVELGYAPILLASKLYVEREKTIRLEHVHLLNEQFVYLPVAVPFEWFQLWMSAPLTIICGH